MTRYIVVPGDCIGSIAYNHGFFWETVWEHGDNRPLRTLRKDPNTLLPGDGVFVPDKRIKREARPVDQRHNFKLRGVPAKLSLQIMRNDEPQRLAPYVLTIDGRQRKGSTDGNGKLTVPIPPNARSGTLVVGTGTAALQFRLDLGHLNPIDSISGVKARLSNLGYPCGYPDEQWSDEAKRALAAFQSSMGLDATGTLDDVTRQALLQQHDVR